MGDEPIGERIRAVEIHVATLILERTQRSAREWTIIMVGIGLIVSIVAKNLGWLK
jgi:hypothetical protein